MNRLLVFENEKIPENHESLYKIVDKYKLKHLHTILKVKINDKLKITLINQGIGTATIKELNQSQITIEINNLNQSTFPNTNLLIGLSRPPTIKKILEHATTMGVNLFHFFKADLSEKSYLQSKVLEESSINQLLELGISQSGIYSSLPKVKVDIYNPLKSYTKQKQKYILSLREGKSFLDYSAQIDWNSPITLAFGPERGFSENEENQYLEQGFYPISLGPSILRVEYAIYSALSQIELLRVDYKKENS